MTDLTALPPLTSGTTKQIAWATKIRAQFVAEIARNLKFLSGELKTNLQTEADSFVFDKYEPTEQQAQQIAAMLQAKLEALIAEKTQASYWIETKQAALGAFGQLVKTNEAQIQGLL